MVYKPLKAHPTFRHGRQSREWLLTIRFQIVSQAAVATRMTAQPTMGLADPRTGPRSCPGSEVLLSQRTPPTAP